MHVSASGHAAKTSSTLSVSAISVKEETTRTEKEFNTVFGHLDPELSLISFFTCDYQAENDSVLYHGKIYISEKFLCFYSNTQSFQKTIPFSDILNINKKNTAIVFANAIGVTHSMGSEFFTSFVNRDKAYESLVKVWNERKNQKISQTKNLIKQESQALKPNPSSMHDSDNLFTLDEEEFQEPIPETINISTPQNSPSPWPANNSKKDFILESEVNTTNSRKQSAMSQSSDTPKFGDSLETSSDATFPGERQNETAVFKKRPRPASQLHVRRIGSPGLRRNFESKDDLTLRWEQDPPKKEENKKDNSNVGTETSTDKLDFALENVAESVKEEEVKAPSGIFSGHYDVSTPVMVSGVIPETSCKKLYARVISSKEFWEHVFTIQENKNVAVTELLPSKQWPNELYERQCSFIAPIKGAPMGPKETRAIQTHRISMPNEKEMIMDTSTKSLDIPVYGDAFVVQTLWNIKEAGEDCKISIRWKVHFLKSVWVKGLIEKNAKTATEEALRGIIESAKKWLKSDRPGEKLLSVAAPSSIENNVVVQTVSTPEDREILSDKSEEKNMKSGFLNLGVEIPMIGIELPVKSIFIFYSIFIIFVFGGMLFSQISAVEAEVNRWNNSVEELSERLVFLQLFTAKMIDYASHHESSLTEEWTYWKRTRGLDWRLAEWQSQMFILKNTVSGALQEVCQVIDSVASSFTEDGPDKLLNEIRLSELVSFLDNSRPQLEETVAHSLPWFYMLAFLTVSVSSAIGVFKFLL